jgi:stringent starvation protein B
MPVHVPLASVLAIFAKENAQGLSFPPPDMEHLSQELPLDPVDRSASVRGAEKPKRDRSHLKVIK